MQWTNVNLHLEIKWLQYTQHIYSKYQPIPCTVVIRVSFCIILVTSLRPSKCLNFLTPHWGALKGCEARWRQSAETIYAPLKRLKWSLFVFEKLGNKHFNSIVQNNSKYVLYLQSFQFTPRKLQLFFCLDILLHHLLIFTSLYFWRALTIFGMHWSLLIQVQNHRLLTMSLSPVFDALRNFSPHLPQEI